MLEILNIVLNNEYVYIGIITVLLIIIIITIFSIKKDRDKMLKARKVKEVEQPIEPAKTVEEQQHAKMELERVVNQMQDDIDKKPEPENEIKSYEQEQEEKAIISYQELVDAVKKNNDEHQAQTEIGMEVADQNVIEQPESIEQQPAQSIDEKANDLLSMLGNNENTTSTPIYQETSVTNHDEELPIEHTTLTQTTVYKEEPVKADNSSSFDFNDIDLSSNASVDTPEAKVIDKLENEPKEEKKYQRTDFISPIYGKQETSNYAPINNNKTNYEELTHSNINNEQQSETRESRYNNENTPVDLGNKPMDVDDRHKSPSIDDIINDELKDNDDFLSALKDFRHNL